MVADMDGENYYDTDLSGSVCLVLGDNIFYGQGFTGMLQRAVEVAEKDKKATIFGYQVQDPKRFGVAEIDGDGNVLSIEEKPAEPKSDYAVVGLYFYPNKVVNVAKSVKPSARGELEITSVNEAFRRDGELKLQVLGRGFAWLDTGTQESLFDASRFIEVIETRQGVQVACLEEIAWRKGWITSEDLLRLAEPMKNNSYGEYMIKLAKK